MFLYWKNKKLKSINSRARAEMSYKLAKIAGANFYLCYKRWYCAYAGVFHQMCALGNLNYALSILIWVRVWIWKRRTSSRRSKQNRYILLTCTSRHVRYYLFISLPPRCIDLTSQYRNIIFYFSRNWIILYRARKSLSSTVGLDARLDILSWHFPKVVLPHPSQVAPPKTLAYLRAASQI